MDAMQASMPFAVTFGTVIETEPLTIRIGGLGEQPIDLPEKLLILSNNVRDHFVWMIAHDNTKDGESNGAGYHDQVTMRQNQDHVHQFQHIHMVTVVPPAEGATTSTSPEKTETQSGETNHDHNYRYRGGVFKAKYGLKKNEKVILLRVQGGQSYIVLDRFEPPIGTEGIGEEEKNTGDLYNPDSNGDRG